jgi:hypothetical protein
VICNLDLVSRSNRSFLVMESLDRLLLVPLYQACLGIILNPPDPHSLGAWPDQIHFLLGLLSLGAWTGLMLCPRRFSLGSWLDLILYLLNPLSLGACHLILYLIKNPPSLEAWPDRILYLLRSPYHLEEWPDLIVYRLLTLLNLEAWPDLILCPMSSPHSLEAWSDLITYLLPTPHSLEAQLDLLHFQKRQDLETQLGKTL